MNIILIFKLIIHKFGTEWLILFFKCFSLYFEASSQPVDNHISPSSYLGQTPTSPARYSPVSKAVLGDDEITR